MPTKLLGPFVGFVNETSAKLWIYISGIDPLNPVKLYAGITSGDDIEFTQSVTLTYGNFGADVVTFNGLKSDTRYWYNFYSDEELKKPIELDGLTEKDLYFRTMPEDPERLDFLLMSCHNPTKAKSDGFEGFRVWAAIPQIIEENSELRFAILGGDQIYADADETNLETLLAQKDEHTRVGIYLGIYEQFWSNIQYRKVLCRMPAVLMWDDHDIRDGWGSVEASFKTETSKEFKSEWYDMFTSAQIAFSRMQSIRNPEPLLKTSFDTAFRIGRMGFFLPDLRSCRNLRKKQIWSDAQLTALKSWVREERDNLDVLFFASSVVFTHGSDAIDTPTVKNWKWIQDNVKKLGSIGGIFKDMAKKFESELGDLRDDIRDSWGVEENAAQTEELLKFLFSLQNPRGEKAPIRVVILSGDIHAGGYSTLYSKTAKLDSGAVIPHIVSSPVSYAPFNWLLEGAYRNTTNKVKVGTSDNFYAQISHHYCKRNVAVISVRRFEVKASKEAEVQQLLKIKYYLEDYPEPQIVMFDLINGSHIEEVEWPKKG